MPFLLTLIALIIMIPAGLAGIWMGLRELLATSEHLTAAFGETWQALVSLLPWCHSLLWLAGGTLILTMAVILFSGGLKSFHSHH